MRHRPSRRSGFSWLLLAYVLLVAYASLYPFMPWVWPDGLNVEALFSLPWPQYWSQFDVWANALGYVPMGLLAFAASWRSGAPGWMAVLVGLLFPSLAAYGFELTQRFVALRVPSLADWALNSAGGALGAVLGLLAAWLGWLERWGERRERWFEPQSAGALALLALWPLGLLFPLPAPLAQGQFLPPLLGWLEQVLEERQWLSMPLHIPVNAGPLDAALASGLGLLAPCLLMLAVARRGWHRAALVLSVLVVGVGMSALAAALGFGPGNAWSWLTPRTVPALSAALLLALLCTLLPARANAVLALPVLTGLVLIVSRLDADPYLMLNLQRWEHGPRVQLYGLLQWLGWLWPLLALGWLMAGLTRATPKLATFARASGR
jgi:VanZ family protein